MSETKNYTADELRQIATNIRTSIAPMMGDFRACLNLAKQLELAAVGKATAEQVQAAVDAIDRRDEEALEVLGDQLDAAFDAQDAQAWVETACRLLPMLPLSEVTVMMNALNDGLVLNAQLALREFAQMPAASGSVN
jgi:hypothetical protein